MSARIRIAAFAALLPFVFGASALAGSQIDVHPGKPDPGKAGGHGGEMAMDEVRGLAASEHGLTLELASDRAPRGPDTELSFRIADKDGATVRDFDVEHTKRMHLIVVRRDLTGFQHLHPVQRADGSWTTPLVLRDAGNYRVFADFAKDGEPRTLAGDLSVDGSVRTAELPAPASHADVDDLRVTLDEGATRAGAESDLAFDVTRDGRPVAIADYLGAKGHLVALREGDLAFLHVHPDEDSLKFAATFPNAGRYRLFLQFKTTDGRLHTAAFTQEVTR
jgi:hypothetical protein